MYTMMPASLTRGLERLLKEASYAQIATLMLDGSPLVTPGVGGHRRSTHPGEHGCHTSGGPLRASRPARGAQRPRSVAAVADREHPRVVDVTTTDADEHIDALAKRYLGADRYPFRRRRS